MKPCEYDDMTESNTAAANNPQQQFNSEYDGIRKGNRVAFHLQDFMFGGDMTQSIDHLLLDYEKCGRQMKLHVTQTPTMLIKY